MAKKKQGAERPGHPQLLLRIPDAVGLLLLRDAVKAGETVQAVIVAIIAEHYGVEVSAPQRGRPKNVESE